jgi:hypothetical protein
VEDIDFQGLQESWLALLRALSSADIDFEVTTPLAELHRTRRGGI